MARKRGMLSTTPNRAAAWLTCSIPTSCAMRTVTRLSDRSMAERTVTAPCG